MNAIAYQDSPRKLDTHRSHSTARPRLRVIEGGRSNRGSQSVHAKLSVRERFIAYAFVISAVCSLCGVWRLVDMRTQTRVAEALAAASSQDVIVHPGDTLWGLAESHPVPGCTTSEVVHAICATNHIEDACLSVGMTISVPVAP